MSKLNLSTSPYSDSDFLTKTQLVYASMDGNPFFVAPVPPLESFSGAISAFAEALIGALAGSHAAVATKNQKRAELESIYVQLGLYVMYVANGNTEILASSSYTLGKQPEPVYITNPGSVTLANGVTSGQLESVVAAVKGSKVYLHQITDVEPTPETVWDSRTCSRSKYTFKDLAAGKMYWVRVAATGSGDQIAYSPVASQIVI